MKRKKILILATCAALAITGCGASLEREMKSLRSDLGGGLERTVTLYDYNGVEIRHWSGFFDVSESENEVYFDDQNGKRVIIQGGIVVNEEK